MLLATLVGSSARGVLFQLFLVGWLVFVRVRDQQLRTLAALPEVTDSVPSTYFGWLKTTGTSNSKVSHTHMHRYMPFFFFLKIYLFMRTL